MSSVPTHVPRSLLSAYNAPGLFITATGSDVGKTTVTAALAAALHGLHVRVGVCKPIATGCPPARDFPRVPGNDDYRSPDAAITARAAGFDPDDPSLMPYFAPLRYATPASPALAATIEQRFHDWHRVAAALDYWQENSDLLLVEGAGGWYVPIENPPHDFMIADLAAALRLPVLIVTTPELGTLNHTLLTMHAIRDRNLPVIGLVINRVPASDKRDIVVASNLMELPRLTGVPLRAVLPDLGPGALADPVPRSFVEALTPFAREWWGMIHTE